MSEHHDRLRRASRRTQEGRHQFGRMDLRDPARLSRSRRPPTRFRRRSNAMPVLEAELWRESDRVSVHVRHLGAKRWQWVEYESVGDGVDSIVVRHELYEHDAEKRPLRYDVAWELVDDGFGNEVLSPTRCRFVGFGAPTKGKDEREGNQS